LTRLRPTSTTTVSSTTQTVAPPRSSQQLPKRRNIFDNDDFDQLVVDTSRLHIGRRGKELTADKILSDRSKAPAKSAIMAALAAFDSDDDERDDTYDAEDVGASVDNATAGPDDSDKNEESLFRAYTITPELFGRDSETRRGKARTALKSDTGMTDEAIEGWGIMLGRDPKRLRRLEAKFSIFAGQQRELAPTAWRDMPAGSGDETGEASGDGQGQRGGRGGFGGRGRGRGRGRDAGGGRGGGSVAGSAVDQSTQIARDRKDANKGSRANHNRKAQRGKKMARAGFPG
jgi:activating signal cointegrator complex subunit 2